MYKYSCLCYNEKYEPGLAKETNMIKINCEAKDTIKLTDMTPFQGNLKKRTDGDIKELTESLVNEGLMMPFAIWKHDGKNYLLDGHGRKESLIKLAVDDPEILSADWPCIFIQAETEDDARKALLQITSTYGKITASGYKQFCVSIPNYKAPSIAKFVAKPVKAPKEKTSVNAPDTVILKIKVKRDQLEQVKEVFAQFDFIEVL